MPVLAGPLRAAGPAVREQARREPRSEAEGPTTGGGKRQTAGSPPQTEANRPRRRAADPATVSRQTASEAERTRQAQAPCLYLIDDDADMRESLALVLGTLGYDVQTFAQAGDFLAALDPQAPAAVVVDLLLPGMSGLKLCAELVRRRAHCRFVVISGHGDVPSTVAAMKLGAVDFLEKPFSRERLLASVEQAYRQSVADAQQLAEEEELTAKLDLLTAQEARVFELIAGGLASKEIAAKLEISRKTVDVHRCRIMQKLEIDSPGQLGAVIAVRARRDARRPPPTE